MKFDLPKQHSISTRSGSRGGRLGRSRFEAIAPPKTYESNFFHHDFLQFGKRLDCQLRLFSQILLKSSPPLNLRAGPTPDPTRSPCVHRLRFQRKSCEFQCVCY